MATVFGEVAGLYDAARPPYPREIAELIGEYAQPRWLVEVGAGTGKGTETLALLGVPMTCVEPDERMAQVLAARFPAAEVVISTFEAWRPPPGGVPLLASALSWHWLHESTRCRLAHDALAPGGALAVFGHQYGFADPAVKRTLDPIFGGDGMPPPEDWITAEIGGSGLFTGVRVENLSADVPYPTQRYLDLVQTYSSFRARDPHDRRRLLDELRAAIDADGGTIVMRLHTTLRLARRPA
ncbi:MAG TPA: class I SAM-dependent methyltransferase [Candidatus Limnocylindrales bacterium]